MKLGRKPFKPKTKDLLYRNYRGASLPPVPASFGHQFLVPSWKMLGNDTVGDCVIAGADHETMLWTTEGSAEASFTAANAISDYSAITGYNPNNPNSDQGTEVRTALDYRRNTGMIDASGKRHKIAAFLLLDQSNFLNELIEAVYLFSATGIGINFPESAMAQFNAGQPWTVVPGSKIDGGHYIPIVGYDQNYVYCVTWGKVHPMTREFLTTYCDEAWAILSQEFINGKGVSPEGFNLAQLQADLAALAQPPSYSLAVTSDLATQTMGQNITITATATKNNAPMEGQVVTIKEQLADGTCLPDNTYTTDAYGQIIVNIGSSGITSTQTVKYYATWEPQNGVEIISKEVDVAWMAPAPAPTPTHTPAKPTMTWIGSPNYGLPRGTVGRAGHKILAIVDHIMDGTLVGTDSWFQNPNAGASAHFGIGKNGEIHQYVDVNNVAWANGVVNKPSWPLLITDVNPNYYTVSIEHEGNTGDQLTDAQYRASLALHRWLIATFGLGVNQNTIIGHCQIDGVNRVNCPGAGFPWSRLLTDLKGENGVILENLVLYYGDADLQIASDLAQNLKCPIVQIAYATVDLLTSATNKYQVGGGSAPSGVTLLGGGDRFDTMKSVLHQIGKI